MCDGVTTGLQALSTAVSIAGSVKQGLDARAASQYNAKVSADSAEQETAAAQIQADTIRRDARRTAAATRASYGASGVTVNSGSAQDVLAQDEQDSELDALMAQYGGSLRARSYRAEAKQDKAAGKAALVNGFFKGGATVATQGLDTYLAYHPVKPVA